MNGSGSCFFLESIKGFSIKQKLIALTLVSLFGLLCVGVAVKWAVSTIEEVSAERLQLAELKSGMLSLRRHEKDFLMRKDDKYSESFAESLDKTEGALDDLIEHLKASDIDSSEISRMAPLLASYGEAFEAVVTLQRKIGFNAESGLYGALRDAVRSAEEKLKGVDQLTAAMLMLRRTEKDFMLRRDAKYLASFDELKGEFDQAAREFLSEEDATAVARLMNDYAAQFHQFVAAEQQLGLTPADGAQGDMRSAVQAMEQLFGKSEMALDAQIAESIDSSNQRILLVLIVVALAVVGLTAMIAASIFRPLTTFSQQMQAIISNKDLTVRVNASSDDEIGRVASEFNTLLNTLQSVMTKINDASLLVASSAEEMSLVTKEVKNSTNAQSKEVEQAAVAVTEMSSTIQEIARNASSAADSVSVVHQQLQEGTRVGDDARREIENLTREVQQAAEAIKELERNSANIGQVLDAIQNVAEQTNLLALNAAIEAARAGEQGRGFAVVADEVRTLAQRTQESTETIRKTISEFQQGTNQVVATVARSNQRAEIGIERVTRSSQILNEIAGMVSSINDMNLQIAAAAEEQGATAEEISRNVNRVTELSRGVSTQSDQTSQASNELAELGGTLREIVVEFRI